MNLIDFLRDNRDPQFSKYEDILNLRFLALNRKNWQKTCMMQNDLFF